MAAPNGQWPLSDLQRQFAYDRLLHRLYLVDGGWIVKGATALLARQIAARHTIDIDIYRATTREQAERDLRAAAANDIGDWFEFEIGPPVPVAQGTPGIRLPVIAQVGASEWARFHVDLVGDSVRMTGTPDDVPPLIPMSLPGLDRPGYRAYPLVDHIADKVCAIVDYYGPTQHPSTRFKDLIDLVTLTGSDPIAASPASRAIRSETDRRGITLRDRFDVPDRELWQRGYAAEATRATASVPAALDEALDAVRRFLDPILDGTAAGTWNPRERRWET